MAVRRYTSPALEKARAKVAWIKQLAADITDASATYISEFHKAVIHAAIDVTFVDSQVRASVNQLAARSPGNRLQAAIVAKDFVEALYARIDVDNAVPGTVTAETHLKTYVPPTHVPLRHACVSCTARSHV